MRYWIAFRASGAVIPYTMAPRADPGDRVVRVEADDAGEAIELAEVVLAMGPASDDATCQPEPA